METTCKADSKILIRLLFIGLFLFGSKAAFAFDHVDGPGDSCDEVIPRACRKVDNQVAAQDNGYHNTLQALRGAKEKTVNVIEVTPETDTAPATYTTTAPPKYKGQPVD